MTDYNKKYIKYKLKYLNLLEKQNGGWFSSEITNESTKEEVLKAVKKNGNELKKASDTLKADKVIVLAAVNQNGLALQYASEKLKADEEVVLAAVKQNGLAFEFISEELKKIIDRVIKVETAEFENGDFGKFKLGTILKTIDTNINTDIYKKIIFAAYSQNKEAIKFFSKNWVLHIIEEKQESIVHISDALKKDMDVIKLAVWYYKENIQHASKELQDDIIIKKIKNRVRHI